MRALHWESWLLRLGLIGLGAFEFSTGNTQGAIVAGEGFVVSLFPLLVERLSHSHVPRPLEFVYVLGMTLQFVSESTKLFEVFYYWDKIVHPGLVALTALMAGWLLLGYRDISGGRLPIQLTAFFAILVGFHLYAHVLGHNQRREMGELTRWLASGPAMLLDRFGRAVGVLVAVVFAAVLGAGVWIDRDAPALRAGLQPGQSRAWTFDGATQPADAETLLGDWVPDQRGTCRVNLEHPRPGSEKMGLLELNPRAAYGMDGQAFTLIARYFEERPPKT